MRFRGRESVPACDADPRELGAHGRALERAGSHRGPPIPAALPAPTAGRRAEHGRYRARDQSGEQGQTSRTLPAGPVSSCPPAATRRRRRPGSHQGAERPCERVGIGESQTRKLGPNILIFKSMQLAALAREEGAAKAGARPHRCRRVRAQRSLPRRRTGPRSAMPKAPTKSCAHCGREIIWRKRWERCWEEIRYCGERCRRTRLGRVDEQLEEAILRLLGQRAGAATICPSEAARDVAPDDWRLSCAAQIGARTPRSLRLARRRLQPTISRSSVKK
jgi:hypothetical protein